MPEIEIYPAREEDLPALLEMDGHWTGDFAWQMEAAPLGEEANFSTAFRRVRLPRPLKGEYPRSRSRLSEELPQADMLLQAVMAGLRVGWCALKVKHAPEAVWISDLVVHPIYRRQGIGASLTLATMGWAADVGAPAVILEMPVRNDPAVQFARKLGFEFNGYQDHYYGPHNLALFFYKSL